MAKLSINLLPPELEAQKKQKQQLSKSLKISIAFLGLVVGLTAVVLSLRLSQNIVLGNVSRDLDKTKSILNSEDYKQREGLVLTLKSRLDTIGTLLNQETYGSYAFNLIMGIAPTGITITNFNVDDKGIVSLTAESNDIPSLETFFNQLIQPEFNLKKITGVTISSINKSKNNGLHTELSVNLAGSKSK